MIIFFYLTFLQGLLNSSLFLFLFIFFKNVSIVVLIQIFCSHFSSDYGRLTTDQLPVESSSFETVICICRSVEFPTDWLFEEILRVLKPGGTILIHKNPQSTMGETDKVMSLKFCDYMKLV